MFQMGSRACMDVHIWGAIEQKQSAIQMEDERNGQGKLTFDLNYFKRHEDKFPSKLVPITYKKPDWRTEEELKQLRNALSSVQSYRRYSNNLQLLLAKVIRHQRFGRRRVVIKKGHNGNSFYFIYSGVVAVTKDEEGSSAFVDKEPTLMRRGAGFGEVSLLKGVKRNATIVCMEETELLVVDKEDFFAKKLDEELKKEFEYRFRFYRSLDLLSSWSFQMIESMADHSKTEEFHYGRVIVKDTSDMANIIFMAKGRCDLLHIVDLTTCHSYKKWISQQTASLKCDKCQFAPAGKN
ncbi:cyclic nucleotide-binding domain-containing protein 2 [Acipenser oxyrinchus oxyrinchus]|uniref:Cyclic nucleotide-binding domain-containing protein 2 n=1 Tax=Acipenser oxyrinchus oxyrinchus TaxID=40147 RepID=A0AAD8DA46_ACIOX|nr:cyclic nucleotide-binding domain-containing protein 2 [Acipenser oxyrinchus oxyrinchus]